MCSFLGRLRPLQATPASATHILNRFPTNDFLADYFSWVPIGPPFCRHSRQSSWKLPHEGCSWRSILRAVVRQRSQCWLVLRRSPCFAALQCWPMRR